MKKNRLHIQQLVFLFLFLSNYLAINSHQYLKLKSSNSENNLIFQSSEIKEIVSSQHKANKIYSHKSISSINIKYIENIKILTKFNSLHTLATLHISTLNFQFFEAAQFSTDI